jgi:hypothetical protein
MIKAVCVDETPPKEYVSEHGTKMKFQLVFETEMKMPDGRPFTIRTKPFGCSLHEKSAFRPFLKKMRGRDLNEAEEKGAFDTESLLGFPVKILVRHEQSERDATKTFEVIGTIAPDTSDTPLQPSGTYVRVKDRPERPAWGGNSPPAAAKPATSKATPALLPWQEVVVHVGKNTGKPLGLLSVPDRQALVSGWMPHVQDSPNPSTKDQGLFAALTASMATSDMEDSF